MDRFEIAAHQTQFAGVRVAVSALAGLVVVSGNSMTVLHDPSDD